MNKRVLQWLSALCLLAWPCGCRPVIPVDLVVYHARVYTANQDSTVAEAFAVHKGKFMEIGSSAFIRTKYKGEVEIDAANNWVYPGFTNARGVRQQQGTIVRLQHADFVILAQTTPSGPGIRQGLVTKARTFRRGKEVYHR